MSIWNDFPYYINVCFFLHEFQGSNIIWISFTRSISFTPFDLTDGYLFIQRLWDSGKHLLTLFSSLPPILFPVYRLLVIIQKYIMNWTQYKGINKAPKWITKLMFLHWFKDCLVIVVSYCYDRPCHKYKPKIPNNDYFSPKIDKK